MKDLWLIDRKDVWGTTLVWALGALLFAACAPREVALAFTLIGASFVLGMAISCALDTKIAGRR